MNYKDQRRIINKEITLLDLVIEKEKEIERLTKNYERIYNENCKLREEHNITDISLLDENERLNNIIKEQGLEDKPNYYVKGLEGSLKEYQQEVMRLNNIINKLEEFIEKETEIYTLELTEKNTNALSYSLPIKAVYKEIYNVLQELKGSDKE